MLAVVAMPDGDCPVSAHLRDGQVFLRIATVGDGACAIHSVLGTLQNGEMRCSNARELLRDTFLAVHRDKDNFDILLDRHRSFTHGRHGGTDVRSLYYDLRNCCTRIEDLPPIVVVRWESRLWSISGNRHLLNPGNKKSIQVLFCGLHVSYILISIMLLGRSWRG